MARYEDRREPPQYESFVLRLRWLHEGENSRCQVMLQATPAATALYFASLEEMLRFLNTRARVPEAGDELRVTSTRRRSGGEL